MSRTLSIGVVGPSYWSYTAAVMASHLVTVRERRRREPAELQGGVHQDAKDFFTIVLAAIGEDVPDNPCASLANYRLATDTLLDCLGAPPETTSEVDERLRQYAAFVDRLATAGELDETDLRIAEELQQFFTKIVRDGEKQDYLAAVG